MKCGIFTEITDWKLLDSFTNVISVDPQQLQTRRKPFQHE